MQVVHPKALGIFFSCACINMFDKQCKCLQERKERKRKGGKCSQCKRQLQFEQHCAHSLTCNALAIPTTHSFSLSLSLSRALDHFLALTFVVPLSLCCQLFPFVVVAFIVTDSFLDALCVWEATDTHTHTTRTHSKKIMQIKLNAIWESTRRPNFTHTHTHSRGTSTSVCLCVCDTSNCINAVFIHTHFQYYRQQLTELLTAVVVLVVVTVVLAVVAGLSYSFYRANWRVCKCECDGNTSAKQLTTDHRPAESARPQWQCRWRCRRRCCLYQRRKEKRVEGRQREKWGVGSGKRESKRERKWMEQALPLCLRVVLHTCLDQHWESKERERAHSSANFINCEFLFTHVHCVCRPKTNEKAKHEWRLANTL